MIANFFVWTAYVDRAYGGPEEGGWYYDTGTPVQRGEEDDVFCALQCFENEEEAFDAFLKLEKLVKEANSNRHSPSSLLSDGDWLRAMFTKIPPYSWPETRPHYE